MAERGASFGVLLGHNIDASTSMLAPRVVFCHIIHTAQFRAAT